MSHNPVPCVCSHDPDEHNDARVKGEPVRCLDNAERALTDLTETGGLPFMVASYSGDDSPNEPQPLGDCLADVFHGLAEPPARFRVIRTSQDEDRDEVPRAAVFQRDGYRCVICGNGGRLEADHIIPWSAGGSDSIDNLRTLCHQCNQERSNFRIPVDSVPCLPNGSECVHCSPELLSYDDAGLVPVFCLSCLRKAPGVAV